MNKTLKSTTSTIIGLIVVSVTVAVFFLGTVSPRELLDWFSLSFVLLSEFLMFGTLIYLTLSSSESNERIIHIGVLSTIATYWVISVVLALLRHLFNEHLNTFVVVNIILIGIASIISVLLYTVASKVQSTDRKIRNLMLFWLDIEKRLYSLASKRDYSEFKQGLYSLYEKVKFSDKVGISTYDKAISDELDNLEIVLCNSTDDKKEKIEQAVSQIMFFVKQRNIELSQSKRGEF